MTYTPVEIMALILIVVSAVKIIVILVNPAAWYNSVVKKVWANASLTTLICLALAAVTLYYLLQELTIVQILAAMLFFALLVGVGIGTYKNEVIALASKLLKDKALVKKSWLYILVWIVLLGWGAGVLFGFI